MQIWFAVVMLFNQPEGAGASLSNKEYPTRAACIADTKKRMAALTAVGQHGQFLCMREREPDRQLAKEPKFRF